MTEAAPSPARQSTSAPLYVVMAQQRIETKKKKRNNTMLDVCLSQSGLR